MATALARKFPVDEAAYVAWKAGTVYVGRKHNKPVAPKELL
jgi:hypothetical protein